jgi:hypothetical protein
MVREDTSSVCAIVKDEREYLVEWVAYYRLLGFDRIIVYSNDCSDGSDALLDAMQGLGLVIHRPWPSRPGEAPQLTAYADAVARSETRWLLFADADEFLNLMSDLCVRDFLGRYADDVGAIAINWRLFGSCGAEIASPAPVLKRFNRAAPLDHHLNYHIKTMAVAADVAFADVHHVALRSGRYVNPNGRDVVFRRPGFSTPAPRTARINHYIVKSRAEYARKRTRGIASVAPEDPAKASSRTDDFFDYHDRNEEEDRTIQHWLPALEQEMARIEQLIASLSDRG